MRKNPNSFVPFGARKLGLVVLAAGAFLLACTLLDSPQQAAAAPKVKVQICHIPPGDPANFHTIKISENAFSAHLAHGDIGGACDAVCAALCDDGNACTIDDTGDCEQQGCPTTPVPVDCDDENQCTEDSCLAASGCVNTPSVGATCDDAQVCSGPDTCDAEGACQGAPIDNCCLDDTACSQNPCDGAKCNLTTNRCDETPTVCIPPDNCTLSECAPDTGDCVDADKTCDEPNICAPSDGECKSCFTASEHAFMGDIQACIDDCEVLAGCGATVCDLKNDPIFATVVEDCVVNGIASACDQIDANGAQVQGCTNVCGFNCDGITCDPIDQCHAAGECVPGPGTCVAGDALPDGTGCDDGNAGTNGDVCTGGVCAGTPSVVECPCFPDGINEAMNPTGDPLTFCDARELHKNNGPNSFQLRTRDDIGTISDRSYDISRALDGRDECQHLNVLTGVPNVRVQSLSLDQLEACHAEAHEFVAEQPLCNWVQL